MPDMMANRRPRISLGVAHARESLEELLADLAEPITITVQGRRAAVLVPYDQYVEMVRALEEAAVPRQPA